MTSSVGVDVDRVGEEVDRRTASQVAAVRSLLQELLAVDVTALDLVEADALHRDLRVVGDQVQAFRARLLAHIEADGRWSAGDARTFPEWVARRSLGSVGGVRRDAELGRALGGDLPVTAAAVAAGEITLEHARVLARFAPTSEARRAALAGGQAERNENFLVDQARHLPADQFQRVVKGWAAEVDATAAERGYEVACAKEYLNVARRDDGFTVQGFLTTEHGTVLLTALRAVAGVPGAGDERTHDQRQGGALGDLARLVLDRGQVGTGHQVRPHLSVHVSWETMERLAVAHPSDPTESVDQVRAGWVGVAELEDGEPIPASLLARIACDSEITRIVFGPDGAVLDVGRAQRTYTGQQRRAVIARDRHCRYPGCHTPPHLGEVHHRIHWVCGGVTSIDNGILLCWFHHDLIHRRGITITGGHRDQARFHTRDGQIITAPTRPPTPGEPGPADQPGPADRPAARPTQPAPADRSAPPGQPAPADRSAPPGQTALTDRSALPGQPASADRPAPGLGVPAQDVLLTLPI